MPTSPTKSRPLSATLIALVMSGCALAGTNTATLPPCTPEGSSVSREGDLVIVGRVVTMDDPAEAEALLIEDGVVTAVGSRDDVMAAACDEVPIVDIGQNVAYPGFIDAHAHWIGDREYYGVETPEEAMDAAIARGWTSISEQWVNQERLTELEALAADDALPLRVDAYLALNFADEFFGDWYADRQPGSVGDDLRVLGLKIHLDTGTGAVINWEQNELTGTIGRANEAGWQVSVHAVSTEAMDMVLDAFEATIGADGPNPLHHRIEHALQVTDDQLARMVAMDLALGLQLDGAATDWVLWAASAQEEMSRDYRTDDLSWLTRWRDFVDAGLHVAGTSDAPWFFTDLTLTDDVGRPVDEIAGGMDGRGRDYPETAEWVADQLLTAEQGLRAVTVDAAHALGAEARRGHLAPGTLGDVTILSGDVLDATPDEIRAMDVVATIVGGVVVSCSDHVSCGGR